MSATRCIENELRERPIEVLRGVAALIGAVAAREDYGSRVYEQEALELLAGITLDAVSQLDEVVTAKAGGAR